MGVNFMPVEAPEELFPSDLIPDGISQKGVFLWQK